ncbi:hypothetical protein ACIGFK_20165 [Streptomyces sp. NPDC085524]|uniref:hypothetical protein n=1 Tax=unclassified Streptomyces TaxID=2593676 RepID=UPI0035D619FA
MSTPKRPSPSPVVRAERVLTYAMGLVIERDRAEAAATVAEGEEVMAAVGRAPVGRIGHKTEQVWSQAVALLGFRASAWFLIAAAVLVAGLLLPRSAPAGHLVAAVAALPAALFASREAGHEIARSALRRRRLTGRAHRWLTRVQSDAFVVLLAVPMYGIWVLVIQPWALAPGVTR